MRSAGEMSSLDDRLADMARTMLSSPSQVRLTLVNPSRRIWTYVSQKDASWIKGSSWPVFWKYCSIKLQARFSGGKAYTFTRVDAGDAILVATWWVDGARGRVMLTIPPRLWIGGAIAGNDSWSEIAIAIARDMYLMKAMLDEGPYWN